MNIHPRIKKISMNVAKNIIIAVVDIDSKPPKNKILDVARLLKLLELSVQYDQKETDPSGDGTTLQGTSL